MENSPEAGITGYLTDILAVCQKEYPSLGVIL